MRPIKIFVTVVLLAMAAMFGTLGNRNQTLAAEFTCQNNNNCPNPSKCTGDNFVVSGCTYTCYRASGLPGQMIFSGSANCGTAAGGGGTGGGGGGGGIVAFNGTEGEYCMENWWWDTRCSGPTDPFMP
ncbi:MAG TPA: hypothetical protein VJT15_17145 [Pyrinomonadaceae bacterium]|nr:hypothetical protein [Pyrinomonadaceae bacterium]